MRDDFTGWYRVGGHRIDFYATDDEVAEWLSEKLPEEYAPYTLVGLTWNEKGWIPFESSFAEVADVFKSHHRANLYVRSPSLTPTLPLDEEKTLTWSGLICVQLGMEREDGRREDSSISIVDRIRHEVTGRERRHPVYLRIFERLRRFIRKQLVVETARTLPNGLVVSSPRMTQRAADAHKRGDITFMAEPVDLSE